MEEHFPPHATLPQARPQDRGRASPLPLVDPDAAMHAPRLQGSGLCSKLMAILVCCLVLVGSTLAVNLLLSQSLVVQARAAVNERLSTRATPAAGTGARKARPAILRRFGALRRPRGSTRGVADLTLRNTFPRWRAANGSLKLEEAITDLALGVAALVEQIDRPQELEATFEGPTPPQELAPGNDDSEREIEL